VIQVNIIAVKYDINSKGYDTKETLTRVKTHTCRWFM